MQVPAPPVLQAHPQVHECQVNDVPGECISFLVDDMRLVVDYIATLERELRAACLAVGGKPESCGLKLMP